MDIYSPKQIADMLQVSTTTLRRYEEQRLLPAVPRTKSKHRYYTAIHLQAFVTIRALLKGYDIPVAYEAMRMINNANLEEARWLLNEQQFHIQTEKQRVEELLTLIQSADFTKYNNIKVKEHMSIGEVAEIAGVKTSAIRHWELEGLVHSERNPENGYRMFTIPELRKILVISSLRKTVYYIDNMNQLLHDLDTQDFITNTPSFQLALENLDNQLALQFVGIAEVVKYVSFFKA
ncbi:MerR family DNA-binding transcriptional regulator [Sporosarcina sp. NPDC096371]|uniref:MerR family DNA-binding transcriptional regulator n=1 Tax=Sporosarcina sp. NPDC096371 TaxID=3364530 RepID=UPI003802EDF5